MASTEELACVYSSLILQDDNSTITSDKIQAMLKAASVNVEPFWPGLFAKTVESLNLKELVSNIGSGAGSGPAPAATNSAPAAAEAKKEEKKDEEEEEEEDDDMGFGLFD